MRRGPGIIVGAALASWMVWAVSSPVAQGAGGDHKYVGSAGCGSSACHGGAKTGNEMKKWSDADPHAKAFDQLGEDKAKKIAGAMGIANAQGEAKCMTCHTTGSDAPADAKKAIAPDDGVSCEGCHGAGADYKDDKHFKDRGFALGAGLIDLAKKDVRQATCDRCHGKIDDKMVAAGHPKASKYEQRETEYKKFAHWKEK